MKQVINFNSIYFYLKINFNFKAKELKQKALKRYNQLFVSIKLNILLKLALKTKKNIFIKVN